MALTTANWSFTAKRCQSCVMRFQEKLIRGMCYITISVYTHSPDHVPLEKTKNLGTRLMLISTQNFMTRRGRYLDHLLHKLTFILLTIDFYRLGGGRYAYTTCFSRVESENWYDNLFRPVLGHWILWRHAQIFGYIHTSACEPDVKHEVRVRLKGSGTWLLLLVVGFLKREKTNHQMFITRRI